MTVNLRKGSGMNTICVNKPDHEVMRMKLLHLGCWKSEPIKVHTTARFFIECEYCRFYKDNQHKREGYDAHPIKDNK